MTVLGRNPAYLQMAQDIGGASDAEYYVNTLNIPVDQFQALSVNDQWALNQKFLDEAIARGDTFVLASPWSAAVPKSFYLEELKYLFSKGYSISLTQFYLIPPGGP